MNVNHVINHNQVNKIVEKSKISESKNNVCFDTYLEETTQEEKVVSLNDIFKKASKEYGVPENLLKAVGYAESSFRVNATSHCGAQGIMQLMPATAKSLGVTDAYDPEQNIMGGAKYLSSLLKKYDGNTSLALAAYNAGSGNVAKYGGIPPFEETQNYVVKVMKYMNQEFDADQKVVVGGSYQSSSSVEEAPVFEAVNEEDVLTIKDQMNKIFSYDDYEMLLKLLKEDEENSKEREQQDTMLSKISMNPSVMNLLKSASIQS